MSKKYHAFTAFGITLLMAAGYMAGAARPGQPFYGITKFFALWGGLSDAVVTTFVVVGALIVLGTVGWAIFNHDNTRGWPIVAGLLSMVIALFGAWWLGGHDWEFGGPTKSLGFLFIGFLLALVAWVANTLATSQGKATVRPKREDNASSSEPKRSS